jgi:hypothetical protein
MPRLQTDGLVLEEDVWKGPSNTNYVDIVMTDDALRSQTTSRSGKYYSAQPFDFPRLYEVNDDIRVMETVPVSTYALDQSRSFAQRYSVKQ